MKTLILVAAVLVAVPAMAAGPQQRVITPYEQMQPAKDIAWRPWIHQDTAPKIAVRPWIHQDSAPRHQFDVSTTDYGLTHFSVGGDVVNVGDKNFPERPWVINNEPLL